MKEVLLHMAYDTDERLKSYLDTNQLSRERMCLAVLAIDKRFSDVRPRHPRGGRDGARDIEALFNGAQRTFGAVGFFNQASDSEAHKKNAANKFTDDLTEALKQQPTPEAFVFFTNVNLTIKEKDELVAFAHDKGLKHAEIFDRERIRITLDGADGFGIRFQYLQIPLSEAEQATFFARWGDDIQGIISEGFGRVQASLNRILFLQEAALPLRGFTAVFELDREYSGGEIGHFRAFGSVLLKSPSQGIVSFLFGVTDNGGHLQAQTVEELAKTKSGISEGICGAQWETKIAVENEQVGDNPVLEDRVNDNEDEEEDDQDKYPLERGSSFTAIGRNSVKQLAISYDKNRFIRVEPGPCLMDIDDCSFVFLLNKRLAEKVKAIQIYANEYKLMEIGIKGFRLHVSDRAPKIPLVFSSGELTDSWVVVAPPDVSSFRVIFSEQTPKRFFAPEEIKE